MTKKSQESQAEHWVRHQLHQYYRAVHKTKHGWRASAPPPHTDQPEGEQRAISFMWLATTESFLCPKQMERNYTKNYTKAERGKEGPLQVCTWNLVWSLPLFSSTYAVALEDLSFSMLRCQLTHFSQQKELYMKYWDALCTYQPPQEVSFLSDNTICWLHFLFITRSYNYLNWAYLHSWSFN